MDFKKIFYFFAFLLLGFTSGLTAQHRENEISAVEERYDPVPEIMHHIQDSHTWHLWGEGHNSVGFSLPVILLDGGLKVFSSSAFGHDMNEIAQIDGNFYKIHHNKIYRTDATGDLQIDVEGHPQAPQPLDFSITKVAAQMILAMVILTLLAFAARSSYKKGFVPTGVARILEPLILFVRDDIALQNIGSKKYKKYTPYLITLFLFVWLINILGLIPGSANVSGNIAFTLVLSVLTLIIVNFSGNKNYWGHIFDPLGHNMPWAGKILVYIILVPVEILGIITKPFALMIRLFANMTAGHIVILSLVSLIFIMKSWAVTPASIGLTLFINILEVLVAALQAYIFTLLTALFIGMAVEESHH